MPKNAKGGKQQDNAASSPLLSAEAAIAVPPEKSWLLRKWRLVLYTVLLLVSSVGNQVYFKRMTSAMPNYGWYLTQVSTVVYMPLFGMLSGPAAWKVTSVTIQKFAAMGLLDGCAGILQTLGGVKTSGTLQVLLQQAAVPITMLASIAFIGRRFHVVQYMGAATIVMGIVIAKLAAGGESDGSGSADSPLFNFIFFLALVPNALSAIFKEVAFRGHDGDLDPNVLQFWVTVFQAVVNFLGMPIYALDVLGPQQVPFSRMPTLVVGGTKCLYFRENQVVEHCGFPGGRPCDTCDDAWVSVLGYVCFNLGLNIFTLLVIKHGSAALMFLVATMRMPLSSVAFSSTLIMGAEAVQPTVGDYMSLVVILVGLVCYRQGGQWLKKQSKRESEALGFSGPSPGPEFASPASSFASPSDAGMLAPSRPRSRFVPLFTTGLPGVRPVFAYVPMQMPSPRSADRVRSDLYRRLGAASPLASPRMRYLSSNLSPGHVSPSDLPPKGLDTAAIHGAPDASAGNDVADFDLSGLDPAGTQPSRQSHSRHPASVLASPPAA
mmetsp:Transcript_25958/g.72455  ORF Transcript_25958/g.72455 Transcript_25958/m.72455 type:complete len:548 (+) Transcript_25958:139-1782(+)